MGQAGLGDCVHIIAGDYTQEAGAEAAGKILRSSTAAVFTGDDQTAGGLVGAVLRAGVAIPGKLTIIGYDDSPSARTFIL